VDGALDLSQLRVRFRTHQTTTSMPNTAEIIVTNLNKAHEQQFRGQEFKKVELIAGYESNSGTIFKGNIKQSNVGRESPTDTVVTLYCGDGEHAHNHAAISKTLKAGSTPKDIYDALLKEMGSYDVTPGYTPDILTKMKYPRPYVMFGMVRDYLRTIAMSNGCTWSIQNGKVNVVPKDGNLPGDIPKINAATGMVGMPVQTLGGIIVRVLINPKLYVDQIIQLNNADINLSAPVFGVDGVVMTGQLPDLDSDGQFRILMIECEGDTRGSPFYMTLTCISKSGSPGIGTTGAFNSGARVLGSE
jgi:hypothetical protein